MSRDQRVGHLEDRHGHDDQVAEALIAGRGKPPMPIAELRRLARTDPFYKQLLAARRRVTPLC